MLPTYLPVHDMVSESEDRVPLQSAAGTEESLKETVKHLANISSLCLVSIFAPVVVLHFIPPVPYRVLLWRPPGGVIRNEMKDSTSSSSTMSLLLLHSAEWFVVLSPFDIFYV